MAQSAVSATIWDGEWDLSSYNLDELLFKNELKNKEVNDPLSKLTKHEIAEQVLHGIEDLGRNDSNDWLDDLALFDGLQTLAPVEDVEINSKTGNDNLKLEEEQTSPNDGHVVPEIQKQSPVNQDLFSISHENAATFILSNENILYIDNQPIVGLTRVQTEEMGKIKFEDEELSKENAGHLWPESNAPDVKLEMAALDEIIRNTAQELDQWESDTTRSEISSDGTSTSDLSPKEEEEEEEEEAGEETDDPDWKPEALKMRDRICAKRAKPYRRGGSLEEKTLRKKEQNRNAATRYRLKKKALQEETLREEEMLKAKKSKLEEKMADIRDEIRCVKKLMRDFYRAKGIIN